MTGGEVARPLSAVAALRHQQDRLCPVDLDDVLAAAELQTRVDRKYLVTPGDFAILVDRAEKSHSVLEIEGRRDFAYESVYFDTEDLRSYLSAARGRRRRFKVRTRTYLDSALCVLEVKSTGGRGETIKDRAPYDVSHRSALTPPARTFVAERVGTPMSLDLEPVLTTRYTRTTLVDLHAGSRMTCDADLELVDSHGRSHRMTDRILVETKSPGYAGAADRTLWSLGNRPVQISKYCIGMAVLDTSLPANKWHRTIGRYFGQAVAA